MFFSTLQVPPSYQLIDNMKKLEWLAQSLKNCSEFAFDIETNWPTSNKDVSKGYPEMICGISFAWGRDQVQTQWRPGNAAYVPLTTGSDLPYWGSIQPQVVELIDSILSTSIPKVAHNGKFDCRKLFALMNIRVNAFTFDTMLAHASIDEDRRVSSHALKSDFDKHGNIIKLGVSDAYLEMGQSEFKQDLKEALLHYDHVYKRYSKVPLQTLYPYACADADLTLALKYVFEPMLEAEGLTWVFHNVVMPLQREIMILEIHGVPLDISRAQQVHEEQTQVLQAAQAEVYRLIGKEFDIASPTQLGRVLFEDLDLPGTKNERHQWNTDAATLKGLDHPAIKPILQYRRAQKIDSSYAVASLNAVEEITDNGTVGWIHGTYWLDSVTGRLKLSDPNLTTLPRPENGGEIVKSMYAGGQDYRFVFYDFSQIELRVIAHLSQEPVWIDGFNAGHDMHSAMAHKIYNLPCEVEDVSKQFKDKRSAAKAVNFGIAFGQSVKSLADRLGMSYEEADKLINEDYFGAAPTLKAWIDNTHRFAIENGYVINLFGRRRHLPDAQIYVPPSLRWPARNLTPDCYRKGPTIRQLGIALEEMYDVPDNGYHQAARRLDPYTFGKCGQCPFIKSCVVNREVKYLQSMVNRAKRQSVNSPVQGTAVDMTSLALCWIGQTLRDLRLPAAPMLHLHDELAVFTHYSVAEQVEKIMIDCMSHRMREFTNFSVPLPVDGCVVHRWSEKHAYD